MLQTDRHRIDMWTQNSATAYNNYGAGHAWRLTHFVKQNGYVNVPLEGLWLRGPYLHNGSVPTLADLLEEPAQRPKLFFRGYDVLDPEKVGFVSQGPEAERVGFRYDTSVAGNSNGGHLWGTTLNADGQARDDRVPEDAVSRFGAVAAARWSPHPGDFTTLTI